MPLEPKSADLPRIRGALKLYKVTSVITGVMLLLLCAEMLLKYVFHYELFGFGPAGFLTLAPVVETPAGLVSTGEGVNLSTGILIAHGWFYVLYLFSDFRLWSLMRWPFTRFVLIALGGIIPFLSFFLEVRIAREVTGYLDSREAREAAAQPVPASDADPVEAQP
ncbi:MULTISPECIES: DUF3817 domain-containing protein [Agromyces]|uniref:DUF3817 domain-containing protein n=2 Tax=Agromyces TaxID=33877 RepID=A0A191WI23_9MICO|nr:MULTISPECIES: DUF3817 domain-containing protein [Agromyces]ANJ27824.1 hypothetical protein ATC03_15010 [Agromyces aureus]